MPDQEIRALVVRLEAMRKRDGAVEEGRET
jgi:hypothetical protein